jgi:hypothetical protein
MMKSWAVMIELGPETGVTARWWSALQYTAMVCLLMAFSSRISGDVADGRSVLWQPAVSVLGTIMKGLVCGVDIQGDWGTRPLRMSERFGILKNVETRETVKVDNAIEEG